MQSSEHIEVRRDDRILTITLNNPERLNAITERCHDELMDLFYEIGNDPGVRVVVITGAGRAFSSGGDFEWMESQQNNPERVAHTLRTARRLAYNLVSIEQPVIAAVNGDAVGLGATLALLCDITIASDRARFGDPHVKVGLAAGDGGTVVWPLTVGMAKAKYYLLTGDLLDAVEAERIGLIAKVVPHDQLASEVQGLAKRLANGPTMAINWTKRSLNKLVFDATNLTLDAAMGLEMHGMYHDDVQEATSAFREKRDPHFKGMNS